MIILRGKIIFLKLPGWNITGWVSKNWAIFGRGHQLTLTSFICQLVEKTLSNYSIRQQKMVKKIQGKNSFIYLRLLFHISPFFPYFFLIKILGKFEIQNPTSAEVHHTYKNHIVYCIRIFTYAWKLIWQLILALVRNIFFENKRIK